jgi:tetratricopeptide (TPR) repeat protein
MKNEYLMTLAVLLLAFNLAGQTGTQTSRVRIWEEPVVLPTYLVDEPDRIPRFYEGRAYQGAQGRVYPYPIFESLSDTRIEKAYDMVFLENEYIRLELLPEIGGRLFAALDKTNDYDFIYKQHVIKPGLIGMLGAWISGGIEWNFPHHHRATAFMPVDYVMQEHADGSSTVWIGELEIRHRMKFMLGVTVYPGKSYYEVTFRPYNRTPFIHSFLYFANTGVHTSEQYQVIFPPATQFGTYHGKNQFVHWPIAHEIYNRVDYSDGVDISWWKNHPEWTSIFCWNYEDDFVGGYDHGKEAGIILVSNHHIAPGKKFWTWSTGPRGQLWDEALTETDGPELELMVGGYSDNQPDYSWLQPYETKYLRQYFYPIREIGSVKNANLEAALNMELLEDNMLRMGLNTTSEREGARVILMDREEVLFTEIIDIDPGNPYVKEIEIPEGTRERDLILTLRSQAGEALISYTPVASVQEEMPDVVVPPGPPEEIGTVEELYMTGLRLEQFYNPSYDPEPYYEEALARDPMNYRVNTAMGLRELRNGRFDSAEQFLQRAVDRITANHTKPRDGEAYYYLGLCQKYQGKFEEAYTNLYQATWSQAFHTAAYTQLAELACRKGAYEDALQYLERSLSTNANHTRALNLKAAILRKVDRPEGSIELADRVRNMDPLDTWALCETFFAVGETGRANVAEQALGVLRNRMGGKEQSYLELSMEYAGAGLWEDALRVLDEIYLDGLEDPDVLNVSPMVYYFLGYFWLEKGEEELAQEHFGIAAGQSPDYCFPFRLESIAILEKASEVNPSDARAPFFLGNLLFDLQPEKALKLWERSVALDDAYWLAHRNLGMAHYKVNDNIPAAAAHYLKAISLKPDDQRLLYEIDLIYAAGREDPATRLQLLQDHHDAIAHNNVSDALSREIMLLVQLGRYSEALQVLEENYFKQWEGVSKAYNSYVDAHLILGWELMKKGDFDKAVHHMKLAGEFPSNMMVAKPYRGGRSAEVYYFTGKVHEAMGEEELAAESFVACVAERQNLSLDENYYYRACGLKGIGKQREADEIFDQLIALGERRLHATEADFFAKFGERETPDDKLSEAYYMMGLGYMGKGMEQKAGEMFSEAVKLNINHIWAAKYLSEMQP